MSEAPYNPDDPLYLASRSLDETRARADAERLRALAAESPEFEREVRALRTVNEWVKRWGASTVEVDEAAFVERVLGRIADDHDEEHAAVDAALRGWRDESSIAESAAFVDSVKQRVRSKKSRFVPILLQLRQWRRPLAVAAMFGVVLIASMWFRDARQPIAEVSYVRVVQVTRSDSSTVGATSRLVVFDRTVVADASDSGARRDAAIAVIGVERRDSYIEEVPPL